MDTLKGKQIMVWTFMGNTSMYQALRENTGGVQDKFLSELVRIMEKYPWCDGVDIDLEKGDDYSTAAKSTAMFRNIYNTVKSYNPAKLMNICLPDMDSINGSVGGENWCVYGVGKYISIERQIEKTKDKYYDVLETSDIGWHEEKTIRHHLYVICLRSFWLVT